MSGSKRKQEKGGKKGHADSTNQGKKSKANDSNEDVIKLLRQEEATIPDEIQILLTELNGLSGIDIFTVTMLRDIYTKNGVENTNYIGTILKNGTEYKQYAAITEEGAVTSIRGRLLNLIVVYEAKVPPK